MQLILYLVKHWVGLIVRLGILKAQIHIFLQFFKAFILASLKTNAW